MYMYMYMYIHFRFPSSKLRHYTYMCVCYTVFVELVFLTNSHGHYHPFDRDKVVYIVAWFLYFWKQLCMAVKTGNDTKYSQPIFSEDGTDTGILFLLYMYCIYTLVLLSNIERPCLFSPPVEVLETDFLSTLSLSVTVSLSCCCSFCVGAGCGVGSFCKGAGSGVFWGARANIGLSTCTENEQATPTTWYAEPFFKADNNFVVLPQQLHCICLHVYVYRWG